jgi:hypothetical protein
VFEGHVEEGGAGLGEHVVAVAQVRVHVDSPAARAGDPRRQGQLAIDRDRLAVAHEDPGRHGGELVPGGEEAAGLVERGSYETAVDDPGSGLVPLSKREGRLVAIQSFPLGKREMNSLRVVATAPASGIMMGRYARFRVYLSPPRSKWAR